MITRRESIKALRPDIHSIVLSDTMTEVERFQNEVLRPILKYQHDIIIAYINIKANLRNAKYESLISIEKERFLDKVILTNPKIKQELHGMILGQFTKEELKSYFSFENEIKRRINTMMRERIVSAL